MNSQLSLRHFLLALAVVFIWGTNFVAIKIILAVLPPLLLGALRFSLVVFPFIFFIKRPSVSWLNLASYGILIGAGQFGLLLIAMRGHITPGLASLIVQAQVFFTIGMSMIFTGERMKTYQWPALFLSVAGLVVIGFHTDADTSVLGIVLTLLGAASWAGGNIVSKRASRGGTGSINMLAYVVWSSPYAAVCLFALAYFFEGHQEMIGALRQADAKIWGLVVWQSAANSLFGYAVWARLLSKYPSSAVTPMALLVPVFGMSASSLWLHEAMPLWKLVAALMVIAGLAINLLWPKISERISCARS